METMLSLSEMYLDTFINRKKYNFLCRRLIKKGDIHIKHAYILFVMLFLSKTCKSIICVSNDTNYCVFSIVHIICYIISTVDNLMLRLFVSIP